MAGLYDDLPEPQTSQTAESSVGDVEKDLDVGSLDLLLFSGIFPG